MKKLVVLAFCISAGFLAYVVYFRQDQKEVNVLPPPQASPSAAIKPSEEAIQYPVAGSHDKDETEEKSSQLAKKVTLDESGPTMESSLKSLLGEETVKEFILIKDFVRRVVVTVDNLPNKHLSMDYWPVKPAPGKFLVSPQDHSWAPDIKNQERYSPYVSMMKAIDSQEAIDVYVKFYPLFQQAYDELGNKRYFNDRVVQVIDHLLQAPTLTTPPRLVKAVESYHYEDSGLESLSFGQKALIRLGPENEEKVKLSLRDLRQRLTHLSPRPTE
jgi:hypothetical protein